jgi:hypothetical protein
MKRGDRGSVRAVSGIDVPPWHAFVPRPVNQAHNRAPGQPIRASQARHGVAGLATASLDNLRPGQYTCGMNVCSSIGGRT